jgi:hypothetical protein
MDNFFDRGEQQQIRIYILNKDEKIYRKFNDLPSNIRIK